jgi:hypothetical protein
MQKVAQVRIATSLPRVCRWSNAVRRSRVSVAVIACLGLAAVASACGGGDSESLDGTPLLTLEECSAEGGSPLFDPDDGRPIQESCPEGLRFLGEFTEPFFGDDGGVCCINAGRGDARAGDDR